MPAAPEGGYSIVFSYRGLHCPKGVTPGRGRDRITSSVSFAEAENGGFEPEFQMLRSC